MSKTIPFPIRNSAGDKSVTDLVTIGIDLGDRWSQICVLNANGEILDQSRFQASRRDL